MATLDSGHLLSSLFLKKQAYMAYKSRLNIIAEVYYID